MKIRKPETLRHRVGVRLSERQWAHLRDLAAQHDTTPSVVVRSLVADALDAAASTPEENL